MAAPIDDITDRVTEETRRTQWRPKPRPIPQQQNKVLAITLAGLTFFIFATLMLIALLIHYATTHHVLPGLSG